MKFEYSGGANKGGIYKITNIQNGRTYYGSAKGFKQRWYQHAKALENGRHQNKFLQADFLKCGSDAFVFEVLKNVSGPKKERLNIEQRYLDEWFDGGKQCYNLRKDAISCEGSKLKDPMQTRKKMSETRKKLWQNSDYRKEMRLSLSKWAIKRFESVEEREKLSEERKGVKNPMFGRRGKLHRASIVVEQICLLTKKRIAIFDSILLAEEATGATRCGISRVVRGKQPHAGGYFWRRV